MVSINQEESAKLLDESFRLAASVKVHQDLCRQVLSLALQYNQQLSRYQDWVAIIQELRNSISEWTKLSALTSFLRCDIISSKLKALRLAIAGFHEVPMHNIENSSPSGAGSLIPTLLAIFRSPDALDQLNSLPPHDCDTAVSLFHRVLRSLTPGPSPLRDLVVSSLAQLQGKKQALELDFDVPDLTSGITDLEPKPLRRDVLGDIVVGKHAEKGLILLRVIPALGSVDIRRRKALRRDLKTRLLLQHEHLLPFYGTCITEYGPAIVSAYNQNGDLPSYLRSHPDADSIALLVEVASALAYLHSYWPTVVHGDVRGANVTVFPDGKAILMDYGLVRLVHGDESEHSLRPSARDQTGFTRVLSRLINLEGLRWAAPEIICTEDELERSISSPQEEQVSSPWNGENTISTGHDALIEVVTAVSDVWSFGMTIYEVLTGRVPYHQHARDSEVLLAISLNQRPLPPSSSAGVRPEWQPELWTLMQDCWRTDRRRRPTMEMVEKRLKVILGKSIFMRESLALARTRTISTRSATREQSSGLGMMLSGSPSLSPLNNPYRLSSTLIVPPDSIVQRHESTPIISLPVLPKPQSFNQPAPWTQSSVLIQSTATIPIVAVDSSHLTSPSSPTDSFPESAISNTLNEPHHRNSTPYSVRSDDLDTVFSTNGLQSRSTSFDISGGDGNSTVVGHDLEDVSRSPTTLGHGALVESSRATTLLQDSLNRGIADSGALTPENLHSESTHSSHLETPPILPPGLEPPTKKPEEAPSLQAMNAAQIALDNLKNQTQAFIDISAESDVLLIIEDADITFLETYDSMRSSHKAILSLLRGLQTPLDLPQIGKLFDIFEEAINELSISYQDYADGLASLDGMLANSPASANCVAILTANENRAHLSQFLSGPYLQLDNYTGALDNIASNLGSYPAFHRAVSTQSSLNHWEKFVTRARLLGWQSLAGLNPLVKFQPKDLIPVAKDVDEEWVVRLEGRLKLVVDQKQICNQMHEAQKRFEKLLTREQASQSLTDLCDSQAVLLQLYAELLDEMYLLQRTHHPTMPPLTSVVLKAVERWNDAHNHHARLVDTWCSAQPIAVLSPLIEEIHGIIRLPYFYLRGLSNNFLRLFDTTPDHHFDIELIIRLLPSLSHLVDVAYHNSGCSTISKEMDDLYSMLIQGEGFAAVKKVWAESRYIIHHGVLYKPLDPNGDRKSIEDRGTSIEITLILLAQALIICEPQLRLGIRRLHIRMILPLSNVWLPDSDTLQVSPQQLFLVDCAEGKKVATPIILRYREPTASSPSSDEPQGSSTPAGIGAPTDHPSSFPNELLLLSPTTNESVKWKTEIRAAKGGPQGSTENKIKKSSMFKLVSLAKIPFMPASTATMYYKGQRSLIVCGGSSSKGVHIERKANSTLRLMNTMQVKQCFVVDSLSMVLFIVGKALWSFKLDDLTGTSIPSPSIIRNQATLFRVGYQRGQLLLVVVYEMAKSTLLKCYIPAPRDRSNRRSIVFSPALFTRQYKPFQPVAEYELPGLVSDVGILDDGVAVMGSSGFQLLIIDQGAQVRVESLPRIPAGASSATAQRCQTSKALGLAPFKDGMLLVYSDFGISINANGEITGRATDWSDPRVLNVAFASPYFFLIEENAIEVRLIEGCRRLETIEGNGFRLVRNLNEERLKEEEWGTESKMASARSTVEDPGVLHLVARQAKPSTGFELLELQLEVLDLSA